MTGCIALAEEEEIYLGHDPELADARWYTKEEVKKALYDNSGSPFEPVPKGREGELRLPPSSAIAHMLLKAFVEDTWGKPSGL
jgi:NAD+ diphosphatase